MRMTGLGLEAVSVEGFADKMHDQVAMAVLQFQGDIRDLEGAIGAFYMAHIIGLRPLYVIHSKNTVKKYIEIIPELAKVTKESDLSFVVARYTEALEQSNFWKAVSGEIKLKSNRNVDFYEALENEKTTTEEEYREYVTSRVKGGKL